MITLNFEKWETESRKRTEDATIGHRRDDILEVLKFGTVRCARRPDGESIERQPNEQRQLRVEARLQRRLQRANTPVSEKEDKKRKEKKLIQGHEGTYVDQAKGLAERVSEEIDELSVEQFRVKLPDTKDAGCSRSGCIR